MNNKEIKYIVELLLIWSKKLDILIKRMNYLCYFCELQCGLHLDQCIFGITRASCFEGPTWWRPCCVFFNEKNSCKNQEIKGCLLLYLPYDNIQFQAQIKISTFQRWYYNNSLLIIKMVIIINRFNMNNQYPLVWF
jgi:hypothetical protein